MVNKMTGIIATGAGTGTGEFNGDFKLATSASLYYPSDIAVDASGNLYIADTFNYRIRKISKSTGIITTIVGTGARLQNMEGAQATLSPISACYGILGDLYIAERDNSKIYHVKLWDDDTASTSMSSAVPTSMLSAIVIDIPTTVAGTGAVNYNGVSLRDKFSMHLHRICVALQPISKLKQTSIDTYSCNSFHLIKRGN